MNLSSLVVLTIIVILFLAALRHLYKNKGGCAGCSHKGCQGCSGCNSCSMYVDATKKKTTGKVSLWKSSIRWFTYLPWGTLPQTGRRGPFQPSCPTLFPGTTWANNNLPHHPCAHTPHDGKRTKNNKTQRKGWESQIRPIHAPFTSPALHHLAPLIYPVT